jgi:hypothetical protein
MCQSQAQGGKRCATHTQPAYSKAINDIQLHGLKPKLVAELYLATSAYATTRGALKRISKYIDLEESLALNQDRNFGYKFGQKHRDIATILRNAIADSTQKMEALKETDSEREAQIQELSARALAVRPTTPRSETIGDAVELVQVAIALGMEVPAIAGSNLWLLILSEHGAGIKSYMPAPSKEIALSILADWVVETTSGYTDNLYDLPLDEQAGHLLNYRRENTDEEIVNEFFAKQSFEGNYSYEIQELKVLGRDNTQTLGLVNQ